MDGDLEKKEYYRDYRAKQNDEKKDNEDIVAEI